MSTKLTRIAELAKQNKKLRFFSIAHLLTPNVRIDVACGKNGKRGEREKKESESARNGRV